MQKHTIKYIFISLILMVASYQLYAQENITQLGRWGKGPCEAILQRGGFTFIGNGSYLEVYQSQLGEMQKLDALLLPGLIKDIWVRSDTTNIYVACGSHGFMLVGFDYKAQSFVTNFNQYVTNGYVYGVMQFGSYLYVADGDGGFIIYHLLNGVNPQKRGTASIPGIVRDVWVLNDTTALVAADTAGVYTIRSSGNHSNPVIVSSLAFETAFPLDPSVPPPKAYRIITDNDSVAYAATGLGGGIRFVDIRDPDDLSELSTYVESNPIQMLDIWIDGNYAHVVAGDRGLYTKIDITDPLDPGIASYDLNTDGFSSNIVVSSDTAYICDGYNGFLIVDVSSSPIVIDSVEASGLTYDIDISQGYAYLATGRSGLKVLDLDLMSDYIEEIGLLNTPGQAFAVKQPGGSRVYIADGSRGLSVLSVFNPAYPALVKTDIVTIADTCYDIDVNETYAFLACGKDGLRIVDITGSIFEVTPSGLLNTKGSAKAVKLSGDYVYLADSSAIYVWDISDLPATISIVDSLTSQEVNLHAVGIDVVDNAVVVANGEYGILIWDLSVGETESYQKGAFCSNVTLKEKTIYAADSEYGLRIYDFSLPGVLLDMGSYPTGGNAQSVTVSGLGDSIYVADGSDGLYILESTIQPEIESDVLSLNFGPVPTGFSRPMIVWIMNKGSALLKVDSIALADSPAFSFSETSFSVAPGDTHSLTIFFKPSSPSPINHSATAAIYSNDFDEGDYPIYISLQGKVGTWIEIDEPYQSDLLTLGLWHMDEGPGETIVNDASSNHKDGVVVGEVTRSDTSKFETGRSIRFHGNANSRVEIDDSLYNMWNHPFTVELWFRKLKEQTNWASLIRRGVSETEQFMIFITPDQNITAYIRDTNFTLHSVSTDPNLKLENNQWYHVAITWDKDTLRLYLNSAIHDQTELRGRIFYENSQPVSIGSNTAGGSTFYGYIDEARISSVARQTWEFPVNKSQLKVDKDTLRFGQVFIDHTRKIPLRLKNKGTQSLEITNIYSTNTSDILVEPSVEYTIPAGEDTTVWIIYEPSSESSLAGEAFLVIESSDPTYSEYGYDIALFGRGVYSFPASEYDVDPFTLGLWHMNEVDGNAVHDVSVYENHGTFSGDVTLDQTNHQFTTGRSLHFGSGNGICVIPIDDQMMQWGGFSVEAWFRLDNALPESEGVLIRRGSGSQYQFDLFLEGNLVVGRLYNQEGTDFTVVSDEAIQYNQWYHTAMTYTTDMAFQDGVVRLYLNGNETDTTHFKGEMAGFEASAEIDTLSVLIGNDWQNGSPFRGNIDEVRISGIGRQSWEFNVKLARIQTSLTTLDFGKVYLSGERKLKLWITNPGIDTLLVESLTTTSPDIFSVEDSEYKVGPNESDSVLVEIIFHPEVAGLVTDTLIIASNDPFYEEKSYLVVLYGEGISEKPTGPYEPDSYTSGLYHFDGESETTIVDVSSAGMDGTLLGGVLRSDTARFGKSLRFDGIDDRAAVSGSGLLNLCADNFTVELWFSMLTWASNRRILISKGSGSDRQFDLLLDPVGGLQLNVWNSLGNKDSLASGNPDTLHVHQWYHAAFIWDGSTIRLYLNNIEVGNLGFSDGFQSVGSTLMTIGADSSTLNAFHGYIDEIRFSRIVRANWEFNVLPPSVVVYPTELDFATVWIGHSRSLRFSIKNEGDQDLVIISLTGADSSLFYVSDSLYTFTLPRMNTQDVEVIFTPDPEKPDILEERALIITTNDADQQTVDVLLRGTGTETKPVPGQYTADAHTLALYHFNTVYGDTMIFDASWEGGHHAMLRNGVRWVGNGLFDGALQFDGIDDYIEIGSHPELSFDRNAESYTIEGFFRTDTVSQALVSKGYTDREDSLEYTIQIDREGRLQVPNLLSNGERVNTDSWYHFALTYNHLTQNYILYLNGNIMATWSWNPSDTVTTQHPLFIGAAELDSALIGDYFDGYIDEVRISDIAREPWEFGLINYGIEVVGLNPDPPEYQQPLSVNLKIPPDLEANEVRLCYGSGGSRTYQKATASPLVADTMQVTLSSDAVSLEGFEYYVEVISGEDVLTYPILDPKNNPKSSIVRHHGVPSSLTLSYRQFKMISVPFDLDSTDVKNVLEDDLGIYDPYQWRLFWWVEADTHYVDYKDENAEYFDFSPGRSYWIISNFDKTIDVESGTTVPTDSSYQLYLGPGWNMISNPYNFSIQWNDCSISADSVGWLYYYDPVDGYQLPWNEFEPWKGYWIYNYRLDTATVFVIPRQSGLGKRALSSTNIYKQMQEDEWVIQISAQTEKAKDLHNYAGIKQNGKTTWDLYDQAEPPPVGDFISFYFDHQNWKKRAKRYAVDMRNGGQEGYIWDCCIETKISDDDIQLTWKVWNGLPDNWEAYFIDLEEGFSKNILKDSGSHFRSARKVPNTHHGRLIVGTRAFIEAHSDGIPLEPIEFRLSQNYPNPFNPDTYIDFSLPKKDLVKIVIYNALGQRVRGLLKETRKAGYHQVIWDGKNDQGFPVSSGVYLYRIEAVGQVMSKKMVLIR